MSSEGVEHLSSVQNNPFIRQYGRPNIGYMDTNGPSAACSASSDRDDDDLQQEYGVNSGFVNKLRSKFTQLESKSSRVGLSRKSASVENLLSLGDNSSALGNNWSRSKGDKSRFGNAGHSTNDDSGVASKVSLRNFAPAGYKPQIRPRSTDLNKTNEQPMLSKKKEVENLKQSAIRSVKPPLPRRTVVDNKIPAYSSNNETSNKVKHNLPEHHDWKVAPDLETYGREDIVIIENVKKSEEKSNQSNSSLKERTDSPDVSDTYGRVHPITDKEKVTDENELPKPNTVSAFRHLFEKTGKAIDTLNVWRHISPTCKSSGSDTNSPQVLSPVSTPRSPLVSVNDSNVFEPLTSNLLPPMDPIGAKISSDISSEQTEISVDTSSVSLQKSMEVFRRTSTSEDKGNKSHGYKWKVESTEKKRSSKELSPPESVDSHRTLTPVHPVQKVFDSKSLASAKSGSQKNHKTSIPKKVPKDVIELKHEHDRLEESMKDHSSSSGGKRFADFFSNQVPKSKAAETHNSDMLADTIPSVSSEENTGFIDKGKDNLSPRQTNIFDSSKMVKKDRDPPSLPTSPTERPSLDGFNTSIHVSAPSFEKQRPSIEQPSIKSVQTVPVKAQREEMEISPVKPTIEIPEPKVPPNTTGMTDITPTILRNTQTNAESRKGRTFKASERVFSKPDTAISETKSESTRMENDSSEAPVSGMSSYLAKLLKRDTDQENQQSGKTTSSHLTNGASPSPIPRKRQAPDIPPLVTNGEGPEPKSPPPLPPTLEPPLAQSKIEEVMARKEKKQKQQPNTKMVFDSSKIVSKRKEPPKRKPPRKSLEELNTNIKNESVTIVPMLDLTCLTNDGIETEYQEGYIPTKIGPCPYVFIGAEVKLHKNPLKKTKKAKVKISFAENATTTFEYEGEESALQSYLQDHPEEKEEVLKQEQEMNGVSSPREELLNDPPRVPSEPEPTIKVNTILGHNAGALTSYKSKMQTQEFQFGMRNMEQDLIDTEPYDEESTESTSMQLLPAGESEVDTFSAETSVTDMLF